MDGVLSCGWVYKKRSKLLVGHGLRFICVCTKCLFVTSTTISLPAGGLSSRSRLRGTQGARVYTRSKFKPRPGSVARALGVQSRAIWQMVTGRVPLSQSHAGRWKTQFSFSCILAPLLYSHAATVQHSLQAFPVFTATDTTYAYVETTYACALRVRVCVCACVRVCASVRGSVHVCAGTWKCFLWYGFSMLVLTRKCKYHLIFIFTRGASPRRADARLGSARSHNNRRCRQI